MMQQDVEVKTATDAAKGPLPRCWVPSFLVPTQYPRRAKGKQAAVARLVYKGSDVNMAAIGAKRVLPPLFVSSSPRFYPATKMSTRVPSCRFYSWYGSVEV
jgi:hypothetical protein